MQDPAAGSGTVPRIAGCEINWECAWCTSVSLYWVCCTFTGFAAPHSRTVVGVPSVVALGDFDLPSLDEKVAKEFMTTITQKFLGPCLYRMPHIGTGFFLLSWSNWDMIWKSGINSSIPYYDQLNFWYSCFSLGSKH